MRQIVAGLGDHRVFVAYDLADVMPEVIDALRPSEPGRLVFAHGSQWLEEQRMAADFTTLLYEKLVSPWNRHTVFPRRPEHPTGPPTESDDQLAARIVAAPIGEDALADLSQLVTLARAAREVAPALRPRASRSRQWAGSPVPAVRSV